MGGSPCSASTVDTTSASAFRYQRDALSSSCTSTFATTPRWSSSSATPVTSTAVPPHPYLASICLHRRRSTAPRRGRGSSPKAVAVTATGSPRSRPAANPKPAPRRQQPTTANPPSMFSLAVPKIRLRPRSRPDVRGASDGYGRSMPANLGETMPSPRRMDETFDSREQCDLADERVQTHGRWLGPRRMSYFAALGVSLAGEDRLANNRLRPAVEPT